MFHSVAALRAYLAHEPSGVIAFVLLIGFAVFAFSLGGAAVLLAVSSPLRRRLARVGTDDDGTSSSAATNIAELLRPYSKYLLPQKETERSRVNQLLVHAGLRSPSALPLFYASKATLMIALPVLVFVASPFLPQISSKLLLFAAVAAAFLGSLAPSVWLDHRVKSRQWELRRSFPDALDLLVVCVEAGLGLAPALQRVADDLIVSAPQLGIELSLVNAEMRAGIERTQALKNLAERTGLADIKGLVALLVQTMRFGTGVADALRVYSEEFRDKRMQTAEEEAAKMGTKMIFPLVLCLFPSFFLVSVGPAVIRLVEVFKTLQH